MLKELKIIVFCTVPILASASPYESLINKHAQLNGLDQNLVKAIITRESNFNPKARSHKDARGLMQVIPSTAKLMGVDPKRLYEPEQSIIAGTRYLSFLQKRYNGDSIKMIAGYNAGHGAVDKYGGIPPYKETQAYVRYVTAKYQALNGGSLNNNNYYASTQTKQVQDILVLASWQKNQYPQYTDSQSVPSATTQDQDFEPVRVKVVNSPTNLSPSSKSFVQTLDKGSYVSVF